MPATSVKQRRFFGMVASGKIPAPKGMTSDQVDDFAQTKEKGLPAKAMADGGMVPSKSDSSWRQRIRSPKVPAIKALSVKAIKAPKIAMPRRNFGQK